ncbi:unnamed protein product [Strongylus vulgaris]|uniref:Uncharacterized protein n=1 Tax=Strongylus vulgaris TaxID=40348 RepID=A0A3P7KGJ1_STRVU|nr:unnamed protein product [Strongylus vulgaris]
MEKYGEKRGELHAAFPDMDNVPHDVIWWALRKQMATEVHIQRILIYHGATSHVQIAVGYLGIHISVKEDFKMRYRPGQTQPE